ncbi:hypothetical protein D3C72_758480 [compost metagenome]
MEEFYVLNTKPNRMKIARSFTSRLAVFVSCLSLLLTVERTTAFPLVQTSALSIHQKLYFSFLYNSPYFVGISNNTISQPYIPGTCSATFFNPTIIDGTPAFPITGYRWEKSTTMGATWVSVGAVTEDYDPPGLTATTWYRRIAINGTEELASNIVKIVIAPVPLTKNSITADQDIIKGVVPAGLIGSQPAGGDGKSYEYLWEFSIDAQSWQSAPGVSNAKDYQPVALTVTTFFRRVVSMGVCNDLTSNTVTIKIVPVKISNNSIIQPLDNEKCGVDSFNPGVIDGTVASVTTGATFVYQWEQSIDGGSSYTDIAGASAKSYDPPTLTQTTFFRRKVISNGTSDTSKHVFIIINNVGVSNNTITSVPDVIAGTAPDLIVGSDPQPTGAIFDYNWEQSTDGNNWTTALGNSDKRDYQPPVITVATHYRRKIGSGVCPTSISEPIKINVIQPGGISNNKITAPPTTSYCGLATVDPDPITGTEARNAISYQWQKKTTGAWASITDATGQNYDPSGLTMKTDFRRIAIAGINKDTSNVVSFLITPVAIDNNTITSSPQVIPSGSIPAIIAGSQPTGGSGTYTYLWEKSEGGQNNWVPASGMNNQVNYQPPAQNAAVYYRRTITSGACSSTSDKYLISIITTADLTIKKEGGISDDVQEAVQFVITAINKGPQDAMNIVVRDTLSNDIEYISATTDVGLVDYDPIKKIIKWEIDRLNNQEEKTLKITAKPLVTHNIVNTAHISAPVNDSDLTNNKFTAIIREVVFGIDGTKIPNMITPNADGKNDFFVVPQLESFANNELTVMDRWGNRVYTVKGYKQDWGGEGLSEGTYFYVLKITVGSKVKLYKGFITLMRSRISG